MAARVRLPAVAGLFYPDDPATLRRMVEGFLKLGANDAEAGNALGAGIRPQASPRALVVPHAGYVYSGAVAGRAYASLAGNTVLRRAIVIGPSHRVALRGMALASADSFRTPLGDLTVAAELRERALTHPAVSVLDAAHAQEHSLEVQLPFLQICLPGCEVLPLSVGDIDVDTAAEVLDLLWQAQDTLLVVSTDLSHFHDYQTARAIDARTSAAIVARQPNLTPEQACGCRGLNGLLQLARRRDYGLHELGRCNSGDTAGSRDRVVGYAAYSALSPTT